MPESCDSQQIRELLQLVAELKAEKVTAAAVAVTFCKRLTQPIKSRVHPAYEYWGPNDPTREQQRKVSGKEVHDRVSNFLVGVVKDKGAQKPFSLKRPPPSVSTETEWFLVILLCYNPLGVY